MRNVRKLLDNFQGENPKTSYQLHDGPIQIITKRGKYSGVLTDSIGSGFAWIVLNPAWVVQVLSDMYYTWL